MAIHSFLPRCIRLLGVKCGIDDLIVDPHRLVSNVYTDGIFSIFHNATLLVPSFPLDTLNLLLE